jgi:hypothetical protein
MENISLTLYTNGFFGSVLKSCFQMGSLSVINSATNISRLGTFERWPVKADSLFDSYGCRRAQIWIFLICIFAPTTIVAFALIFSSCKDVHSLCLQSTVPENNGGHRVCKAM